jgi:imidazoleglycerol phosphate dehydratase HisB
MREAEIERITKETKISMNVNADGSGKGDIESGTRFFDHMLESFARGAEAILHAKVLYGISDNAMFKAFARSMNSACEIEGKVIQSTKGAI